MDRTEVDIGKTQGTLDFDVIREEWNKYRLVAGALVRAKASLSNVTAVEISGEKQEMSFTFKNAFYKDPSPDDKGTPSADSKITAEDVVETLGFEAISEPMNVYDVPGRCVILAKSKLKEIRKTRKFDSEGNRIYAYTMRCAVSVAKYPDPKRL